MAGTQVMGILNITPDSFSDGGRHTDPEAALARALEMEAEGADWVDVGGESTRPGSDPVSEEEELRRVLPVLKKIVPRLKIPVSLDTRKASVARTGIEEGVRMINDISALRQDQEMVRVVAGAGVSVILMHMKGRPKTMQERVHYDDVVAEVSEFLRERVAFAVKVGIGEEKILLDPGIGFGKSVEHNLAIIKNLETFVGIGRPVVIGASRKSFLGKILSREPQERVEGGLAVAAIAVWKGAAVIRTHDVGKTRDIVRTIDALKAVDSSGAFD